MAPIQTNINVISIQDGICRSVQNRIDAFLRHELAPYAMRWFLDHLLECRCCLEKLEQLDRGLEQPDSSPDSRVRSPEVADKIIDRIRAEAAHSEGPGPTKSSR
jgi:hypothetical protein